MIEHLFDTYEVPDELRGDLLHPYLFDIALQLLRHLNATSLSNYNVVKKHIMNQLRLTPKYFLQWFNSMFRGKDETNILFMSRPQTLLSYYVDSRKVTDFDSFKSLILADKMKNMLSEECLK